MTTMPTTLDSKQLDKLVEEAQELKNWLIVRDFVHQVYGFERVAKFTIETYGEYNDEGGYDYYVENIYAVDAYGKEVEFDFSPLFWQGVDFESSDSDTIQELALDHLKEWEPRNGNPNKWLSWSELPHSESESEHTEYDLTNQPKLSFIVNSI